MSDKDLLLTNDTLAFHRMVCGPSKLHPSYFRLLIVLRDYNTSPAILSQVTGLGLPRIRQRLKQMKEYGYVEVITTLSDKTQIWGLASDIRRRDVFSFPTEADVQQRLGKIADIWSKERAADTKTVEPRPDGVVRPRNPAKVDSIDVRSFKQYEAKVNQ